MIGKENSIYKKFPIVISRVGGSWNDSPETGRHLIGVMNETRLTLHNRSWYLIARISPDVVAVVFTNWGKSQTDHDGPRQAMFCPQNDQNLYNCLALLYLYYFYENLTVLP